MLPSNPNEYGSCCIDGTPQFQSITQPAKEVLLSDRHDHSTVAKRRSCRYSLFQVLVNQATPLKRLLASLESTPKNHHVSLYCKPQD